MLHLIRIRAGSIEVQAELCLFFGRTPASRGDEIRPASAVTVVGRIVGDPKRLKSVKPGAAITVSLSPAAPG